MKWVLSLIVILVSFNAMAKSAEKERKPSNNPYQTCTASIRENQEFGYPDQRAQCAVKQIVEEKSLPSFLDAQNVLAKSGYTKPFGSLKSIELKSNTAGTAKSQYSLLVVKTYSQEGGSHSFGIQNSILFYIDVIVPNNYNDSAQIEVRKIVANP